MTSVHRGAAIFAGIFSLLQAIIWVVLAIFFVAAYTCHWDVTSNLSKRLDSYTILYITYFKGPCSGEASPHAEQAYIFMLIYAIISACWIPTSVLLIVAAVTKSRGCYGACLYIPWLIVTFVTIVIDLVGTVLYGIDISRTLTLEDYNQYMSPIIVKAADGITALPAIEMTLFFSRVVVVWIINLVLFFVVIQAERSTAKLPAGRIPKPARDDTKSKTETLNSNADLNEDRRQNDIKNRWDVYYPQTSPDLGDEDSRRQTWIPHPNIGDQNNSFEETYTSSSRETTPYSKRVFTVDGTPVSEIASPFEQPKENNASKNGTLEVAEKKKPMIGWSYTQGIAEIKRRRDSIEGVEKPPVPVPDYTLHVSSPRRYPTFLKSKDDRQEGAQTQSENNNDEGSSNMGLGVY